jgi:hypothetical protein
MHDFVIAFAFCAAVLFPAMAAVFMTREAEIE